MSAASRSSSAAQLQSTAAAKPVMGAHTWPTPPPAQVGGRSGGARAGRATEDGRCGPGRPSGAPYAVWSAATLARARESDPAAGTTVGATRRRRAVVGIAIFAAACDAAEMGRLPALLRPIAAWVWPPGAVAGQPPSAASAASRRCTGARGSEGRVRVVAVERHEEQRRRRT